jgi:immunity protein 26 of polymorphic toxin system
MAKKKEPSKRQKYKVGQIVAIPLPDRKFAYAKVFNDFDLGVYDFLSDKIESLERVVKHKFAYFNAVTDRAIKSGAFLVIGEQPFPDEESAWAPPMASGIYPDDPDVGVLHIAHKGISRRATPKEAAGMDVRDFSQRPELFVEDIVDRLVKGNHHKYRLPK